ncbi:MAG: PLP-dependent aminotransferase family protein [Burkholderiales bacterium]|nr:PLP-dependent aminotransferase family protein [Burkholderiales bacterium]
MNKSIGPLLALDLALPGRDSRQRLRALCEQLRSAIVDGRLRPGLRLPATRALAAQCGVARNTVVAAYDLLQAEGYLQARHGAGTFVAPGRAGPPLRPPSAASRRMAPLAVAPPPPPSPWDAAPPRWDFRLGTPAVDAFPYALWQRIAARTLRRFAYAPLGYGDPQGDPALRAAIAGHVSFTRAVAATPAHIVVTAGAQQAFDLIGRVLVRAGVQDFAVENPGYPPAHQAFAAAGARLWPVPVDLQGLVVEQLPAAARAVFVTPSHQSPFGVPLSAPRRRALLDWARRHGAVVIEDDYDGEFRYEGRALDALQTLDRDEAVFYVGTFSKSLFPTLRIGYVVAPPWAVAALTAERNIVDGHGALLAQRTLADFIAEGHLARHVRRMGKRYAARRAALIAGLQQGFDGRLSVLPSMAGLHLAAALAPGVDVEALLARCVESGLAFNALAPYALTADVAPALAFGYGAIDAAAIPAALRCLRKLVAPP